MSNTNALRSDFDKQIVGYRPQDKLGHREISKANYITSDWFLDSLGDTCNECNCELVYI